MPTKKKKFIDKKNSVTFHLVHRSQQDPLAADESAPQHVLLQSDSFGPKRIDEQRKYGIYYDDNYNYLQHLKDIDDVPHWEPLVSRTRLGKFEPTNQASLQLPSSVFASSVEEPVGLLNKAAPHKGPRPDWDPDVVAALDDDFDFEDPDNQLEDDFITMANLIKEPGANEDNDSCDSMEHDGLFSDDEDNLEKDSRFTNYSISSSVLPRSENLQTLDERFEMMYADYEDDTVGALDGEEFGGYLDPKGDIVQKLVDEFEESQKFKSLDKPVEKRPSVTFQEVEEELVDVEKETRRREEQWDCESILSTYSNLYNRPKLISERITVSNKTGLPNDVLQGRLTQRQLRKLQDPADPGSKCNPSVSSRISSVSSIRLKDETPEERKERKKLVKEMRKERRLEKKANQSAFKDEAKRQQSILLNLKQNLQGIKLH